MAELKKRIQEKEKERTDKSSAGSPNEPGPKLRPPPSSSKQVTKKAEEAPPRAAGGQSPAPDTSQSATPALSPKLQPSPPPRVNKLPQAPKIKPPPSPVLASTPRSHSKAEKKKQPKFSFPKLKSKGQQRPKIQIDDEDDFFKSGAVAQSEHHVHQHDHLHAHKAFHKHKESHEHAHAHNNDHVHNHKHTHNHVHNHIHKHNEQHEHQAEHQHTEKHHHKHIEYIDGGGWKKRSDPAGEDNLVARSDESNPTFEPFEEDVSADKLEERSGMIVDQKNVDVENNLKAYLRKYIEFYKSVADSDIDTADERNDYHDGHISMTNKKNAFPDTTFVLADDNDYDHQTSNNFYHPEAKEDNTEILPNYEKDAAMEDPEDAGLMTFDDYMIALSDQFPELNDDDDEPDYAQYGQYGQDLQDLQWSPLLQELQLAFYDAEPDWQPELQVELGSTRH